MVSGGNFDLIGLFFPVNGAGVFNNKIMGDIDWKAYIEGNKPIDELDGLIEALRNKLTIDDELKYTDGALGGMLQAVRMNPESGKKWRRSMKGRVISPEDYERSSYQEGYPNNATTLTPTAYSGYKNLLDSLFTQAKERLIKNIKRLAGAKDALNPSIELLIEHTTDRTRAEKLQGVLDGTHAFMGGRFDNIVPKDDIIQVYRDDSYTKYLEIDGEYWSRRGKGDISKLKKYEDIFKGSEEEDNITRSIKAAIERYRKTEELVNGGDFSSMTMDEITEAVSSNPAIRAKVAKMIFDGEIPSFRHMTDFINNSVENGVIEEVTFVGWAVEFFLTEKLDVFVYNGRVNGKHKPRRGYKEIGVGFTKQNSLDLYNKDGIQKHKSVGWTVDKTSELMKGEK